MLRPSPRLLLLLPTVTYRTVAFVEAARRLAAAGVAVPRFELLTIAADPERVACRAAYPCVLKPLRLSASRGVVRADDPRGFVAAFRRLKAILEQPDVAGCGEWARHILVEEFVPGREVAVEGLVTRGSVRVLTIFD